MIYDLIVKDKIQTLRQEAGRHRQIKLARRLWKSPKPMTAVRPAMPGDESTIIELGKTLLPAAHIGSLATDDMNIFVDNTFNYPRISQELTDPNVRYGLVEDGRSPIGMVKMSRGLPPAANLGRRPVELSRLYVQPKWIGKGAGSRLMQWTLNQMAMQGFDICWLLVWTGNVNAQNFYQRWGFSIADTVTLSIGQSQVQMNLMSQSLKNKAW